MRTHAQFAQPLSRPVAGVACRQRAGAEALERASAEAIGWGLLHLPDPDHPMPNRRYVLSALLSLVLAGTATDTRAAQATAGPLADFWAGPTVAERQAAGARAAGAELGFDNALRAFEQGPPDGHVATGRILASHEIDGVDHPYLVFVPSNYDLNTAYPVRFYLHGGVSRASIPANGDWWRDTDRLRRDDVITVIPASWGASTWWQESQLRSLRGILAELRRTYNVDDNRIHMLGISDGATGVWYFAFRDPTPWAGFVSLIGHPAVLASPQVGAEGQMHVANLRSRPFLAINGGIDRLYPARSVRPYVELFSASGVNVEFVERPDDGHTVSWWPEEADRIERFMTSSVRDPLPAEFVFETADIEQAARFHWVVVEALGATSADVEDFPVYERPMSPKPMSRIIGFPHPRPSGRVEVVADGNTITLRSRGVRRLRLLLSPRQFDFAQPLRVVANGVEVFSGPVRADTGTLLAWAAIDLDRGMPFGAEVTIDLDRLPPP